MSGFSSVVGSETIMSADNASFDGTPRGGAITTDAELWIGSTALPHVKKGTITSPLGTLTVGYSDPNITLDLAGGSVGIDSINVDASTPPGTDPVLPDVNGEITVTGAQVASGTVGANVLRSNSLAANTYTIEVQRSGSAGSADSTLNGVSHFDSAVFSVDSAGFVSAAGTGLGQTITGDSGGALTPTAGNWNILGGPGVTTSGSGSTLTINSVVFTDDAVSATVTRDSGSFCTAAGVTLTLPSSPAQGELLHFVCATSDTLILQAPAATTIRIGSLASSVAGTATSTLIGDSLTLRYHAASTTWIATSVIGTWVVA